MMNRILFTAFLLVIVSGLLPVKLKAESNFRTYDSITYQAYIDQNWPLVLQVGNEAISHDFDYYYLRMRMGAAAYELSFLPLAIVHYEKALEFNNGDPTAQKILYHVFLAMGKNPQAYQLTKKFNPQVIAGLNYKMKFAEAAYTGGGASFSNNFDRNSNTRFIGNDNSLSSQVLFGDKQFYYGGIQFNLSPSLGFYLEYDHLAVDKRTRFSYVEDELEVRTIRHESWGYQYEYNTTQHVVEKEFNNKLQQDQLYANLRLQLEKGWSVSLFGNGLFIKTDRISVEPYEGTLSDTLSFMPDINEVQYYNQSYLSYRFKQLDTTFFNYVAGFHLTKDYNQLSFGFTGITSNINDSKQKQVSLDVFYYLGRSVNFYGITEATWMYQNWYGYKTNRFIFRQVLGQKIYKTSWLEAEYIHGNLNNASIKSGMIVFNHSDNTDYRMEIMFHAMFGQHLDLSLRYQYVTFAGNYYETTEDYPGYISKPFEYQAQNIIGGIKWTF